LINDNYSTPLADTKVIKAITDEFSSLLHILQIDGQAIEKLWKTQNDAAVNQLTGQREETAEGTKSVNSLQFLVQLNIVRFGTISLIGIAIGILAPLYRFFDPLGCFLSGKS
jgi:hypothetical protein